MSEQDDITYKINPAKDLYINDDPPESFNDVIEFWEHHVKEFAELEFTKTLAEARGMEVAEVWIVFQMMLMGLRDLHARYHEIQRLSDLWMDDTFGDGKEAQRAEREDNIWAGIETVDCRKLNF